MEKTKTEIAGDFIIKSFGGIIKCVSGNKTRADRIKEMHEKIELAKLEAEYKKICGGVK